MTGNASDRRRFRVRALHDDIHHGRVVSEPSFEAAAIAFVEHMPMPAGADPAVSVVVHDVQTGHEHRFRIDLGTGQPALGPPTNK